MTKPIRIFYSRLSGRFYASAHYREEGDTVVITGKKYDVTNEIAHAIVTHEISFTPVNEDA